ncbi:putative nuclease HARBI1 [Heptranchias perlo]|uniref:putative nuclease HARBI1 n=1 Tax=Heptranchias perlo TaxID=212740 RepID=UPI00355A25B0
MRNRFIMFPLDRDKQSEQARKFAHIVGFPIVQGANDCTHIDLCAPHINSAIFINRKGFHSLNVQLVCSYTHRIMEVGARYPGRSHDTFVMQQSNLPAIFHPAHQVKGWLLGDKGYPLTPWLMTPVRNSHTRAEQAYNESHAATRNIVEHTIGLLKQCFHCLDHSGGAFQCSAEWVGRFVVVCCMLHKLTTMRYQPLQSMIGADPEPQVEEEEEEAEEDGEEPEEEVEEDTMVQQGTRTLSARALRARLIHAR